MEDKEENTQTATKERSQRRGLKGLDGDFYHSIQERNDADKAFNNAQHPEVEQSRAEKFDFQHGESSEKVAEKVADKPAEKEAEGINYHCDNCQATISEGQKRCPNCGIELDWSGV